MSHNSAAGHWFKVGSWTVAGLLSFSRVAAARRIPSLLGSNLLMRRRNYYVYIMSSLSRTLYTGVTNGLERRVGEHKEGKPGSFRSRYRVNRLVSFEEFSDINQAIAREKEIKSMTPSRGQAPAKVKLVESINPEWRALSQERQAQAPECGIPPPAATRGNDTKRAHRRPGRPPTQTLTVSGPS